MYSLPHRLGGSSSGRTTDSGSVYLGSNPSPPATLISHDILFPVPDDSCECHFFFQVTRSGLKSA
jgi:hypothetical protein